MPVINNSAFPAIDTRANCLNDTASLVYGIFGPGQSVGEIFALVEKAPPEQQNAILDDVTAALQKHLENMVLQQLLRLEQHGP